MTEAPQDADTDRLERIRQRNSGTASPDRDPGHRRPRSRAVAVVVGLMLAGTMIWILLPQQVRTILGFGTSEPEVMQQTTIPPDISTDVPRGASTEAPPAVNTGMTPRPQSRGQLSPEDQARLAALEEELRSLRTQPQSGVSREDLQMMLDAQAAQMRAEITRQLAASVVPAGIDPSAADEAAARQRMEEERARRAEIEARQVASSGLVLDESNAGTAVGSGGAGAGGRRPSGNEAFLIGAAGQGHETVRAEQLADPSRMIVQGTILEGVLETAINTDLPGSIRAVLSRDVLSFDGSTTLLPRGTRLIGTYRSDVQIAQKRALVAWTRAVTPDGTSVALGGIGADALGRSGQTGHVDTHFAERFGSAALISIFGIAPQVAINKSTNEDMSDAIEGVGDDLQSATRGSVDAYLRIAPTINVRQGEPLTIFVNRDLVF